MASPQHARLPEGGDANGEAPRVAEAWGYLRPQEAAESLALCDRVLAITWKLTR